MLGAMTNEVSDSQAQICVAICTHNRQTYLRLALESLLKQSLSSDRFEILVVDNGSTDRTRDEVLAIAARVPNLKYVFESQLGLSVARNTALRECRSPFIAYLDDDAIASPCWVEDILNAFSAFGPRLGCIGGRIDPIWEKPRPEWLSDEMLSSLTILNLGSVSRFLDPYREPVYGANMSFSCHALRQVGAFEQTLGRVGNRLLSGEEILVQRRLARAGYATSYLPSAFVQHHVVAERLELTWFAERFFWQGVSESVMQQLEGLGLPSRAFRTFKLIVHLAMSPFFSATRSTVASAARRAALRIVRRRYLLGSLYGHLVRQRCE